MDVATVIGLFSGVGLMIVAILMGGDAGAFWSLPSIVIVLGGTAASTLINYPLKDVLSVLATVKNAFIHKAVEPEDLIERLVRYAGAARREGVLSLEAETRATEDAFMRRGLQMAVDGASPDLIKEILLTDLAFTEERHMAGQAILLAMGNFAPAYGMIGTLVGLVHMFMTLNDPSRIGHGMAVAILTTLYGVLLANMVFLPAAGKLRVRTNHEMLAREIIIEGVLSIQSGESPYVVDQKLKAFVAPAARERVRMGRAA
jgi:chemotaxis protein MotA